MEDFFVGGVQPQTYRGQSYRGVSGILLCGAALGGLQCQRCVKYKRLCRCFLQSISVRYGFVIRAQGNMLRGAISSKYPFPLFQVAGFKLWIPSPSSEAAAELSVGKLGAGSRGQAIVSPTETSCPGIQEYPKPQENSVQRTECSRFSNREPLFGRQSRKGRKHSPP